MYIEVSYDGGITWKAQGITRTAPGGLGWGQSDKSQGFSKALDGTAAALWTVSAGKTGYIQGFWMYCSDVNPQSVQLLANGIPIRYFQVSAGAPVQIADLGVQVPAGTVLTLLTFSDVGKSIYVNTRAWEQ